MGPIHLTLAGFSRLALIALGLFTAPCGPMSLLAAPLTLATGPASDATLVDLLDDRTIAFQTGAKRTAVPWRDLVRFGEFRSAEEGRLILLAGGDILVAKAVEIGERGVSLRLGAVGSVTFPRKAVHGIILSPPRDARSRDRLLDDVAAAGKQMAEGDRVMLDNGDVTAGTLGALNEDRVAVETSAGKIEIPLERVQAIALAGKAESSPARETTRLVVGLRDGSRVTAVEAKRAGDDFALTTTHGVNFSVARADVIALQALGGRATYLSDLKPASFKHVPYLATSWPLAIDRSVAGGRLRAGGNEFLKGLGMHSAASAAYTLDGAYQSFAAELAIDDHAAGQGSVVFRVYTDDGGGWKMRHQSGIIRGGEKPAPISIDLTGTKRLSLIVDFADRADQRDHADWLNARLVK